MPILKNNKNLLHLLPIKTERLKLVNIDLKFAEDIVTGFTPNVEKFMVLTTAENIDDLKITLQKKIADNASGKNLELIITDLEGNFIGMCGIVNLDESLSHFTIWLAESAWGKGYGKEAIKGIYDAIQGEFSYIELNYPVEEDNTGSAKIAISMGAIIADRYTIEGKEYIDYRIK